MVGQKQIEDDVNSQEMTQLAARRVVNSTSHFLKLFGFETIKVEIDTPDEKDIEGITSPLPVIVSEDITVTVQATPLQETIEPILPATDETQFLPTEAPIVDNPQLLPTKAPMVDNPQPLPTEAPMVDNPQPLPTEAPMVDNPQPLQTEAPMVDNSNAEDKE